MPEAVVQLLSFFEASTSCKDECNFEGGRGALFSLQRLLH